MTKTFAALLDDSSLNIVEALDPGHLVHLHGRKAEGCCECLKGAYGAGGAPHLVDSVILSILSCKLSYTSLPVLGGASLSR